MISPGQKDMSKFEKDLKQNIKAMDFKIRSLRMKFNISIGWQLDEATDELAEQFLNLTGHQVFDKGVSTNILMEKYNLLEQEIWKPLENVLFYGHP
jgi:hypothetical protein